MSFDPLDEVLRQMDASPNDAYWARRLLDLVRDPGTAARLRAQIVAAVQRWAAHDPTFFVHERYLSEQLAVWTWPREILEDLDAQLVLADESLRHLVLGRLWLEARRPPKDMLEFYGRAAKHLSCVDAHMQTGAWHEAFGVTDPDTLATRALGILESAAPERRSTAPTRGKISPHSSTLRCRRTCRPRVGSAMEGTPKLAVQSVIMTHIAPRPRSA